MDLEGKRVCMKFINLGGRLTSKGKIMKINLKIGNISDILFIVSFVIFLSLSFWSSTLFYQYIPEIIAKVGFSLVIILGIIREVFNGRYLLRQLFFFGIILLLTLTIMLVTNILNVVAISVLLIFLYRDVPFTKIAKVAIYTSLLLLILTIIMSKLGFISNYVEFSSDGRIRNYLGFRYSLFAPTVLLNIVSIWCFINREKFQLNGTLILLFCNQWIYWQTDSRLTYFSTIFLIILYCIFTLFPTFRYIIKPILKPFSITYVVSAMISYYVAISYANPSDFIYRLNHLLGRRIYLSYYSLQKYGFNLFGQEIVWQGNGLDMRGNNTNTSYLYVDNMYIQILQRYGLIFLVIFLVATIVLIRKLIQRNEVFLVFIIVSLGFHAIIDDLILYPQFNTFWFLFAILFHKDYLIKEKIEKGDF